MRKHLSPLVVLLIGTVISALSYLAGYVSVSTIVADVNPVLPHLIGTLLAGSIFMGAVVASVFLYLLQQSRLWRDTGRGGLSFDARVMLGLLLCVGAAGLLCSYGIVDWPGRPAEAAGLVAALTVLALTLWVWVRVRHRWGWTFPGLPRAIVGLACALVAAGCVVVIVVLPHDAAGVLMGSMLILALLYLCAWALGLLTVWDGEFHIQCRIAHSRRGSRGA